MRNWILFALIFLPTSLLAAPFERVFMIVFENESATATLSQPFFAALKERGVYLAAMHAEARPSQPNYLAMVSGSFHGVQDNNNHDLDKKHIGDLLEAKGLSWKTYVENLPRHCNPIAKTGKYTRKHNPFMSFKNVSENAQRCAAHMVDADTLDKDIRDDKLPVFSLYIPNLDHSGHDTGIAAADAWFSDFLEPKLKMNKFTDNTLIIVTLDEPSRLESIKKGLIYTVLFGDNVRKNKRITKAANHYSLLKLIEDSLGLGNLGLEDATASALEDVFIKP